MLGAAEPSSTSEEGWLLPFFEHQQCRLMLCQHCLGQKDPPHPHINTSCHHGIRLPIQIPILHLILFHRFVSQKADNEGRHIQHVLLLVQSCL